MAPVPTLRRVGFVLALAACLVACSKTNKVKTDAPAAPDTCTNACASLARQGTKEANPWCGRPIAGRVENGELVKGSDTQECVDRCEDEGTSAAAITCASEPGATCAMLNGCDFLQ